MRLLEHRGHHFATIASIAVLSLVAGVMTVPAAAADPALQAIGSLDRGGHDDRTDPVLMFAADGMRQDLIEKYAKRAQRALPGFAELLRSGASASGDGMLTQAPPNTGAGWYTMATGAWPGVHRFHQQHVPHQHPAVGQPHGRLRPRACCRPRPSPSPPSAAARRSSRWNGPAAGTAPSTVPPSISGRSSPAAASPPTSSHRPTGRSDQARSGCSTTRSSWPTRPAGPARHVLQPGQGNPHGRAGLRRRQVRPGRLHLRQHRRQTGPTTTGCCSRATRMPPSRSPNLREGPAGRRQGQDQSAARSKD